ncbi:TusE/DsrC/DsvC family sulfur relay protein [Marimonas arenosa]|uniref:TusE/DsrC/DsvC family sulfur relay protein n=1 Tax=Marimonas arenosa TaxID=1795305 RepID=A0AAE3WGF7_9RHOB|nr:TusE/DsrC/DsvC family sulfur relay protein [Marimonas arenosa]MDQ2091198.1 TusE/DsrC/DsvC family sulfur relay protein [Marimonas arenosa]
MRTRPDKLTELALPGGKVTVDEYGYLTDPFLWSPAFAEITAAAEGITLTRRHYEVIDFIRAERDEHGITPDQRHVLRFLGHGRGLTKSQAKDALYALFPQGYVKQACKIAGMKQPRAWSTG